MYELCIIIVLLLILLGCIYVLSDKESICLVSIWLSCIRLSEPSIASYVRLLRSSSFVSYADITPKDDKNTLQQPHFILLNHVDSHYGYGSLISLGGTFVQLPARIICFKDYSYLPHFSRVIDSITKHEIRIDVSMSKSEKLYHMIQGCREAFADGHNVILFIDSGRSKKPMRTLYHELLKMFPTVWKQLVHIQSNDGLFQFKQYEPTKDLDTIMTYRRIILSV